VDFVPNIKILHEARVEHSEQLQLEHVKASVLNFKVWSRLKFT
jgi:hypothetical protein